MGATTSSNQQTSAVMEKKPEDKKEQRLKILCVLTGNKYKLEYVYKLGSMLKRNIKIPFDFICYTDHDEIKGITIKKTNKSGWWGKVDIFKEKGPCLFFDLDTIIISDITSFAKKIFKLKATDIVMIKPWIQKGWASGIMAWNGDLSIVKKQFTSNDIYNFKWDQKYITSVLKEKFNFLPAQNFIKLFSYKHHCRMNMNVPKGSQVICFHGRPNPHEVKDKWVKELWR